MRKLGTFILAFALVGVPSLSYADVLWIPMPTKVEMFKKLMLEKGIDLYGTDDSDGHVENHGTKIKVVTNFETNQEHLDVVLECALQARR
jgi:hypothetical protein